jgi:PAS domain-containing protein
MDRGEDMPTVGRSLDDHAGLCRTHIGIRDVIDSVPHPFVVAEPVVDDSGTVVDIVILEANQTACRSFGVQRGQLLEGRLGDLLSLEAAAVFAPGFDAVMSTGEPFFVDDYPRVSAAADGAVLRYDIRVIRIDGGMTFTWRDVTDRYEQRRHFELMIANSADVVLFVRDGRLSWVSPSVIDLLG